MQKMNGLKIGFIERSLYFYVLSYNHLVFFSDFFDPFGVGSGSDLLGDLLASESGSCGFTAPPPGSNSSLFNLSEFCYCVCGKINTVLFCSK